MSDIPTANIKYADEKVVGADGQEITVRVRRPHARMRAALMRMATDFAIENFARAQRFAGFEEDECAASIKTFGEEFVCTRDELGAYIINDTTGQIEALSAMLGDAYAPDQIEDLIERIPDDERQSLVARQWGFSLKPISVPEAKSGASGDAPFNPPVFPSQTT